MGVVSMRALLQLNILLFLLSCSGSKDRLYSDIDVDQEVISDSVIDIMDDDGFIAPCIFNESPIDISIEGFGCEEIMAMEEGTYESFVFSGRVSEVAESYINISRSTESVKILLSGIPYEEISSRIRIDYGLILLAIGLNNGKCVRGIVVYVTCPSYDIGVWMFRSGDLHNPLYPEEHDGPRPNFYPVELDKITSNCEVTGSPYPGCNIMDVYDILLETALGEEYRLKQGENVLLEDIGYYDPYTLHNIFSYNSPDCGGDNLSYLFEVVPSPLLDCE
jgi:hypothetical protein